MKYEKDMCQVCGTEQKVVNSSNKLARPMCSKCIADSIDMDSAAEIKNLSETFRIPFSLKEYYSVLLSSNDKYEAMESYLTYLADQPEKLKPGVFEWHEIDNHYNAALSYTRALAEIVPLKDAITERGKEKWGHDHTFQEIIKLEQIYENTVRQYNITSSLQQDAIKKAAKLSVKMDSLISANEYKDLKDATAAQSMFLKTANIEDLVALSDDNTIRTVADLASYLEKMGFQFNKMLPNVTPDETDILMDNYVKNVKEVVYNATGIGPQFKDFIENIKKETELQELEAAQESAPLAYIEDDEFDADEFLEEEERKLDLELETEEFEVDYNDDNLYY